MLSVEGIVGQNARLASGISDRGYVMQNGEIVTDGKSSELAEDETGKKVYLGKLQTGRF